MAAPLTHALSHAHAHTQLQSQPHSLPSSPAQKRKRALSSAQPPTPPLAASDPEGTRLLSRAVNVLSTAATALSQVSILYESDQLAREGLLAAVDCIAGANRAGGKLIICGVGKSGLVGRKMVATMKSLGVACSFLHAAEAIHGDLGDIRQNDVVMFISYSGKTAELLALLTHIPSTNPLIAITSHKNIAHCPLLSARPGAILLPAPIHELEETSFGVCAPTTSTTVTIAVGDMLALTVADALHDDTRDVFRRNHPGGAIGAKTRKLVHEDEVEGGDVDADVDVDICAPAPDGLITPPAS